MKVLVVAAHPDDEILGCGATMALHALQGHEVHHLILATGLSSRGDTSCVQIDELRRASQLAATSLGVTQVIHADFPDNSMDDVPLINIVKYIESFFGRFNPDIIYTHFPYDLNVDHQLVSRAVITAARPTVECSVSEIRFFEIMSSTEWANPLLNGAFTPNIYVNVQSTIQKKLDALNFYSDEMRTFPHPRSCENVLAKAKVRGAESGYMYSEAFLLAFKRSCLP